MSRIGDVVPDFSVETTEGDAKVKYPQGYRTHRPYLRTVAQPK